MSDHVERLNPGPPTTPRQAASVILVRPGGGESPARLELLLARRTPEARFMANVWVFPGGAVGGGDAGEQAHRVTALRELEEEVSIRLPDTDELIPFSRWITPVEIKIRFDTRFYLAAAPPGCRPRPDGEEIVETSWLTPGDALARHRDGELQLVFPTIKQLEALEEFETVEDAFAEARSRRIEPILPRVVVTDDGPHILLPGEPGYESG